MRALADAGCVRAAGADHPRGERADDDLVAAAREDPTQFASLYDRYFPRVHGYVRLRVADEATAEDITSQVFLTALAKIGSFEQRGSFGAWLFRVAQNAIYDAYRRDRSCQLPPHALQDIPDLSASPEHQALVADSAARLRARVAMLPPAHQHLLALRFGAELNSREIGRILGKNPAAVRVSLHRILAELRRRYSDDDD